MRRLCLVVPVLLVNPCLGQEDASAEKQLIEKARAIHKRVLTLDTHKDISSSLALEPGEDRSEEEKKAFRMRNDPTVRGTNRVDFPKMREGGYDCAFYIVYVGQGRLDGAGYIRAKQQAFLKFDAIHRMAEKYPDHIGLATTPDQVRKLHDEGKLIACIGIENGYPMGTDLSLIEEFHKRGARYMSICHNRHSQLGDSHTPKEPLHGGLSELGRKAIAEMNRVGIMVDVSHSNKQTMMQALEVSKAPVIASHSGCKAICGSSRNLDDEQLLALKKNGGVVQCVALGSFVKDGAARREAMSKLAEEMGVPRRGRRGGRGGGRQGRGRQGGGRQGGGRQRGAMDEETRKKIEAYNERVKKEIDPVHPPANVQAFVDHIDHAVKLIGLKHVAISSDFDGGGGIEGWQNAAETFNVTLEMVRRGYTEAQIAAIWSGNTLRLWSEVEAIAQKIQK